MKVWQWVLLFSYDPARAMEADAQTMIDSLEQTFTETVCAGVSRWAEADKSGEFHNPRDMSRALLDIQEYRDREEARSNGIFVHYIDG